MKKLTLRLSALFILVAACTSAPVAPAQIDPPFPESGPVGTAAHVYPIEQGWFEGQPVQYYNFGTNTPLNPEESSRLLVSPVYALITGLNNDGSPIKLEGQDNLFEVKPGDEKYTDLWQAHFVTPSEGYTPNSITSVEALLASGMTIEKQAVLVNCPFVAPGSSLADNAKPLTKGWVKDQPVVYFDFGPTSAQPGKVYAFVTGLDANGKPQLVPGQHFVFSASRTSAGYSDFWIVQWVTVDGGYKADTLRTEAEINSQTVTPSGIIVNYPQK